MPKEMAEPLTKGLISLGEGRILVDCGPVRMTVAAWRNQGPATEAAAAEGGRALTALSRCLETVRLSVAHPRCRETLGQPSELKMMIRAVKRLSEPDLTPLAVAGTFSGLAPEAACRAGADRVLVDNGGDIASACGPEGRPFRLGLISDIEDRSVSRVLELAADSGVRGVATSGLGGRSLTKGVASAVTCLASNSRLADAAATAVSNATQVDNPGVEFCRAEELDPLTDLTGQPVVKRVVRPNPDKTREAVERGLARAERLMAQGMILGCLVFVQGRMGLLPPEMKVEKVPGPTAILGKQLSDHPNRVEALK